jgi:ElaA protein
MKIESKPFSELSLDELYACLKLRSDVFVVEQDCVYPDLDDLDQQAIHVIGYDKKEVIAYARILAPGVVYEEPAIGRVATSRQVRGTWLWQTGFSGCA